jgi:sulfur carrier protein
MRVFVNGDPAELDPGATVQAVIEVLAVPAQGRGVAVAVDSEVVPRGRWSEHELSEDARVEIVRAVQGG